MIPFTMQRYVIFSIQPNKTEKITHHINQNNAKINLPRFPEKTTQHTDVVVETLFIGRFYVRCDHTQMKGKMICKYLILILLVDM